MSTRYGASYRNGNSNGNGYGNFGRPQQQPPSSQLQPQQQQQQQQQQRPPSRPRPNDDYDPYGDGYSSGDRFGGSTREGRGPGVGGGGGGGLGVGPRSTARSQQQQQTSSRYGVDEDEQRDPVQRQPAPPSTRRGGGGSGGGSRGGGASGTGGSGGGGGSRGKLIVQDALDHIRAEWPAMCETDCIPVQMALQLLDSSSVGRAHEYRNFQQTHQYLQDSLKSIVHDYHQGFNSSIGTFHKIQSSIQASQKRVRGLKETLGAAKASLCKTDPELKKLYAASQMYDGLLQTLGDLEELRQVPERLEARISEKQFLTAVDVLQHALRKLRKPELDSIGGLSDLRSYLANQETALMDILVEELHEHLYLKSPYCQERWQSLAKLQGTYYGGAGGDSGAGDNRKSEVFASASSAAAVAAATTPTFYALLDGMELERAVREDPARNPESDSFYYLTLVIESLNKLGRLEAAVDQLKQRLPVELFSVVSETVNEVDQKHPSSLRGSGGSGGSSGGGGGGGGGGSNSSTGNSGNNGDSSVIPSAGASSASSSTYYSASSGGSGLHIYGSRETQMRADVIYDLLQTLYGKFEAIAEGHRVFHEYIKALIRREGAGNNSALLGSFKELWNLYQNEIRSLLHNYVTTDADLYRPSGGGGGGGGGVGGGVGGGGFGNFYGGKGNASGREHIFKFADADAKSVEMSTEYDELDGIIRTAVPGLTSNGGAGGAGGRKSGSGGATGAADKKASMMGGSSGLRKSTGGGGFDGSGSSGGGGGGGAGLQLGDMHKSLVEPSVFNMSLLLPPTLVFLQRLKSIVPPGSDLATSTLTSFLDNFLVNVFQPQLEETLGKLSDIVFGEADAFQPDAQWSRVARRPVFKGTTAFFSVVTAFCRMLDTIPHDQALSLLLIRQMMRYYDRCFDWFRALVTKTTQQQGEGTVVNGSGSGNANANANGDDGKNLRASACMALETDGDVATVAKKLWAAEEAAAIAAGGDEAAAAAATLAQKCNLLRQEVRLVLARAGAGSSGRLGMSDVISDRDTITSLCLLYTSMKWLAVKVRGLRHITQQDADALSPSRGGGGGSGNNSIMVSSPTSSPLLGGKPEKRRWTLLNNPSKTMAEGGPVYLPMTQETVQSFDSIVASYEELATTALLTLHLEVRCRIAYALGVALSPQETAPYLLDQDVNEPDPQILALNSELIAYDETVVRFLRAREVAFVRTGLGRLINEYLVGNARMVTPMNAKGCGRMQLNILVLQQNLKNVEEGVDLARAANYYALFDQGPDAIVAKAKECKERGGGGGGDGEEGNDAADVFTYEELKELMELYYSEQLANPERGIENAARRQMGEKLMELGEHLWQM